MSNIEKLIGRLCPNGVTHKALKDVATVNTGTQLNRSTLALSGLYPVMNGGINPSGYHSEFNTKANTTVISQGGASAGYVTWMNKALWAGAHCFVVLPNESIATSRFLFHFLKGSQQTIQNMKTGAGIPGLNRSKLIELIIPLPPIEIQNEIVSILDKFTELEEELEAELDARIKQFEYYRNKIIDFENVATAWIPFGDLATIQRGASPRPIQKYITDSDDGIAWIKIGDTNPGEKFISSTAQRITPEGALSSRRIKKGDFILSNSMSFGRPYISKIDGCIHDGWLAISDFSKSLNSDYLYHLLQSSVIQMEFSQRANSGSVSNLNAEIVKSVKLPVPTLELQNRMALALNRLESLVQDRSDGIPAELNARRQQYEHYRYRLLTFKNQDVA
jgi:type I restriction enzyme S subunit